MASHLKTKIILLGLFVCVSIFLQLHHEPWRDEAQAWLIARDIPNLPALFNQLRYEGAPVLWYLFLMPLARSGLPMCSMAWLHIALILTAATIFVWRAPFRILTKAGVLFSYSLAFEYNVIVRSYALSVLFLFLVALTYRSRWKRPIIFGLLLALLAQTNVHSLVITLVMAVFFFWDLIRKPDILRREAMFVTVILIIGIGFAVFQLRPPKDIMPLLGSWNTDLSVGHLLVMPKVVMGAFIPIPIPMLHFWNTLQIFHALSFTLPRFPFLVGAILFTVTCVFFLGHRRAFFLYVLGTTALMTVFFLKYEGNLRHHGFFFILFLVCLWIARTDRDRPLVRWRIVKHPGLNVGLNGIFTLLIAVQVVAFAIAAYYEITSDFSTAQRTAAFLKERGWTDQDTFIVSYPSTAASAILPHLDGSPSTFYYLEYGDARSYMTWTAASIRNADMSPGAIADAIDSAAVGRQAWRILFITNQRITDATFLSRFTFVTAMSEAIVTDESFVIYQRKGKT